MRLARPIVFLIPAGIAFGAAAPKLPSPISTDTTQALLAAAPKFDAPATDAPAQAPAPAFAEPTAGKPAAPEGAKPDNSAIRLEPFVVEGNKALPQFPERAMHTDSDFNRIAIQRFLSELDSAVLNRWSLFSFSTNPRANAGSKEGRAIQMYQDEQRLMNMAMLKDDSDALQRAGAPADSNYIKRTSDEIYMREIDFGFERKK